MDVREITPLTDGGHFNQLIPERRPSSCSRYLLLLASPDHDEVLAMKNLKRTPETPPVWCDGCYIRIAPYDRHVVVGEKLYHPKCYSRLARVKRKRAA